MNSGNQRPATRPIVTDLLPRRARGRPKGSKTRLLSPAGALGVHHFAFLRSWFLRLDVRDAWQRYLSFAELGSDLRRIEHRRAELLRQVLQLGHQLNLSLPAAQQITAQLELLAQEPFRLATTPLPSLDDFVDAMALDREFYSEADLLQEYRTFYHLDTVPDDRAGNPAGSSADVNAQVRALNQVEALMARQPVAADRLALWLSPALARRLQAAGIATLGALADTVRVYGHNWFTRAPGLGAVRAQTLVGWLAPLAGAFGNPIPDQARQPPQRQRALRASSLHRLVMPARFGIVPLDLLAVPRHLAGGQQLPGGFTTGLPNQPGAGNDLQALQGWLKGYQGSKATHRAYLKETERFYLWCLHLRGKPLAMIDTVDCRAYQAFLAALPAEWINPVPTPRKDPAWRPFRGPLGANSQKYALVVVRALFDGLRGVSYLAANPMDAVNRAVNVPQGGINADRSFTDQEWVFVRGQLAAVRLAAGHFAVAHLAARDMAAGDMAAGPPGLVSATATARRRQAEALRLRLILELLVSTGLRLAEIANATLAHITEVAVAGEPTAVRVIQVQGQGDTPREVPIGDDIMALIAQHHADAAAIAALPCPAPVLCTLAERPRQWVDSANGSAALELQAAPTVRALSAAGIYLTLKRFFKRISKQAHAVDGLSSARFLAASTHWLRHTFGRQGAAAGVPVEVLRLACGHASLNTTSAYLGTERAGVITELRKARRPPAAD